MINNSSYGAPDPQQETLQLLASKDAENLRLRQQLFESVEKYDDLSMSCISQEAELKYANKRDVERVEKELNMRSRDHAELLKINLSLRKQLASLKQQNFQNEAQIKHENDGNYQKKISGPQEIIVDPTAAIIAPERYKYPIETSSTVGIAPCEGRELSAFDHKHSNENSNPSDQPVSLPLSISSENSNQQYRCNGNGSSSICSTGSAPTQPDKHPKAIPSVPRARIYTAATPILPIVAAAVTATLPTGAPSIKTINNRMSTRRALRAAGLLPFFQDFLISIVRLPLYHESSFRQSSGGIHGSGNSRNSGGDSRYQYQSAGRLGDQCRIVDPDIFRNVQAVQQCFNSVIGAPQTLSSTSAPPYEASADLFDVQLSSALCVLVHKLVLLSSSLVNIRYHDGNSLDCGKLSCTSLIKKNVTKSMIDTESRFFSKSHVSHDRGDRDDKGRGLHDLIDSLLRCLALLGGVIDYMSAETVAAVRKARYEMILRVRSDTSRRNDSDSKEHLCHIVGRGIQTQVVDLNETFDKIAGSGIADVDRHQWEHHQRGDSPDNKETGLLAAERGLGGNKENTRTTLKRTHSKRHNMESTSDSRFNQGCDSGPYSLSSIPKDPRAGIGGGGSGSGRGLGSGVKSNVTFADRSHSTPIISGGGSDRSVSGDESIPQSVSTAFDSGFPTHKRARIKSALSSNNDSADSYSSSPISPFSLSCLIMPGVSKDDLNQAYYIVTTVAPKAGDDSEDSPIPLSNPQRDSSIPLSNPQMKSHISVLSHRISLYDECCADLPRALASVLGGLIALVKSLGTSDLLRALDSEDVPSTHEMSYASHEPARTKLVTLRQNLSEAAIVMLNKVFLGDSVATSLCRSDDMADLLSCSTSSSSSNSGNRSCDSRSNSDIKAEKDRHIAVGGHDLIESVPIISLFTSFLSPSSSFRAFESYRPDSLAAESRDDSRDVEMLERDALGCRSTVLTRIEEQQLASECKLLSSLHELLKNKSSFRKFMFDDPIKCEGRYKGGRGRDSVRSECKTTGKNLIRQLCRKLLVNVTRDDGDGQESLPHRNTPYSISKPNVFDCTQSFNIVRIKISVIRFLTGLVEDHGTDGVAAIFGVSRLPLSLIVRNHELKRESGDEDGDEVQEMADITGRDDSQEEAVNNSAVHCITLCWMLSTRTLDMYSSSLSPKGLLLSQLVDGTGRLLDLIAGHVSPQDWSEAADDIINRQMSKRVAHNVHPSIQKQMKDNPFYNLW